MTERTHEELKSLLAAYVLGATDQNEMRVIRAHILTCEECMAEADSLAGATESLALSVEPVELPAGFADAVLAKVRDPEAETTPVATAEVKPRRTRRFSTASLSWAAASLAIIALLGVGLIDARSDLGKERKFIQAVLRNEGMALNGESGAAAKMIPTADGGIFVADGLPEPPEGSEFQLWLLEDGQPSSAGTFGISDGGVLLEIDDSLEGIDGVAVTIEPLGGSAAPTSDPILATG
jgi:anti-sigma-K factor RskA